MANRIMLNETSYHGAGADYIVAIGGGSSMDTAKAIGIIIANPEFEDVRSLEGTARQRNRAFQLSQCRPRQGQQLRLRSTM